MQLTGEMMLIFFCIHVHPIRALPPSEIKKEVEQIILTS